MGKYIDSDELIAEIKRRKKSIDECSFIEAELGASIKRDAKIKTYNELISIIGSLQQEREIVEFSFKGGTYRVNGEDHTFKGGKAKVIILEINQEDGNE